MDALYSRQIGVLGKNAMKHISNLNVVIMGCDTIGIETAKSLAERTCFGPLRPPDSECR
jgi:molybdopterin/thiamine biosynthesis adenylyltransferase